MSRKTVFVSGRLNRSVPLAQANRCEAGEVMLPIVNYELHDGTQVYVLDQELTERATESPLGMQKICVTPAMLGLPGARPEQIRGLQQSRSPRRR